MTAKLLHGSAATARSCGCPECVPLFHSAGKVWRRSTGEVNEAAVADVIAGDRHARTVTVLDREEAVLQLLQKRWSARRIAERTGLTERSVYRIRRRLQARTEDGVLSAPTPTQPRPVPVLSDAGAERHAAVIICCPVEKWTQIKDDRVAQQAIAREMLAMLGLQPLPKGELR